MLIFPKDFPEKLCSTILTSEVVGKKVKLKLRGKEFHGLCPFHSEKTPSFTVNDQKGFYHCFGCAKHGNIITFVMENDGLSFPDAVRQLAEDFGIQIPKVHFDEVKEDKLARDYLILEKICVFFEKNLYEEQGIEARNYLKKRNLTAAIAKKFRVGFSPNSYEALTKFLKSENFTDLEISRTGVVGQNEQKRFYDKFRNRVIFPIFNKQNHVIAFGGRTIGDDMPKYLNSAETDIFKKSQTLYNFSFARKAIFGKAFAVVVEGYMDAISLFVNGVENVVAGLGTALSADHIKELFYTTDRIVICLDGDAAGIRAAKRVSEIALPLVTAKKNITFVILPNKMDPDDFIKTFGSSELEKRFAAAIPLSESLFEFAMEELGIEKDKKISAENKAKLEANLANKIAVITDSSTKKYFAQFFKDLLFYLGRGQSKIGNNFTQKLYAKPQQNATDAIAKNIIALMLHSPDLAQFCDNDFDIKETQFANENLTHLKELAIELIENNSEKIIADLEKSGLNNDVDDIKNILTSLKSIDSTLSAVKFRILLLKDLLLQVHQQYNDSLSQIDEIGIHQNQKIKEIFDYKKSLEQKIISLEKEII